MKRLILVSFLFMGWAFYELSDGADFQPALPSVAAVPDEAELAVVATSASIRVPASPTAPASLVQAVTLVASPAIAQAKMTAAPLAAETEVDAVARLGQVRASFGQGLTLFPGATEIAQPLMLASLEQGAAGLTAAPLVDKDPADPARQPDPATWVPEAADIREITGTRVNMRDGPGTIYPVLSRLTIGHEVEVLGDSGTGWLRLRTMPEQQIGWISASLVSKAAR